MSAVGPDRMLRPLDPLWRALVIYRLLTMAGAVAVVLNGLDEFAAPGIAVGVTALVVAWTAFNGFAYLGRVPWVSDRLGALAAVDVVFTVLVILGTLLVYTPAQLAGNVGVLGSTWTSGAVLAAAVAGGMLGGLGAATAVATAFLSVKASVGGELSDVAETVLAGLTIGYVSTVLRRSADRVRVAVASEAAMAERDRLARAVHDGVLQVLGFVRRRGQQLGGEAGELAKLAGEQEIALRTLLTTGAAPVDIHGRRDLAGALRMLGSARVSVSAPAHPVPLPAHAVEELVAVVGAALANVALHVGPDAPAWVLVEDMGDAVEISVRDEGGGIAAGRLDAAEAEGRLGVARSMRGRVRDLRGTITCDTGPGRGTDWIIRVPRTRGGR